MSDAVSYDEDGNRVIEWLGELFVLPEAINERRVLKLAKYANAGATSDNMKAMVALDDLLEQCVRPEDTERFDALCDSERVSTEQLFEFTGRVLAALAERPTTQPAVSSAGLSSTPESSVSRLEVLATERYSTRPDLYIAATQERATA